MVDTNVIGAVQYTISLREKDIVDAIFLSNGSMALRPGVLCRGRAVGDTSNGFPGDYVVSYYGADERHVGDFDWHIEPVAAAYRLTWRNREGNRLIPVPPGDLVFEGFGFPNGERSIVVAYWMVEKTSAAMRAAAQDAT